VATEPDVEAELTEEAQQHDVVVNNAVNVDVELQEGNDKLSS